MKEILKSFEKIPHDRLVAYLLLLGLLPLLFVGSYILQQKSAISSLSEQLSLSSFDVMSQNKKELANRTVRSQYQNKDQFYLIKQLESMTLQKEEIAYLKKTLESGYHHEEEAIRSRLLFLSSSENSIAFQEGQEKRLRNFRETELSLQHPVEVNLQDLKTILARIEDVKFDGIEVDPSRPHLFFSDFKIEKKKVFGGDAFSLTFKVVKREYVS